VTRVNLQNDSAAAGVHAQHEFAITDAAGGIIDPGKLGDPDMNSWKLNG
jgi:hypothetical protein